MVEMFLDDGDQFLKAFCVNTLHFLWEVTAVNRGRRQEYLEIVARDVRVDAHGKRVVIWPCNHKPIELASAVEIDNLKRFHAQPLLEPLN